MRRSLPVSFNLFPLFRSIDVFVDLCRLIISCLRLPGCGRRRFDCQGPCSPPEIIPPTPPRQGRGKLWLSPYLNVLADGNRHKRDEVNDGEDRLGLVGFARAENDRHKYGRGIPTELRRGTLGTLIPAGRWREAAGWPFPRSSAGASEPQRAAAARKTINTNDQPPLKAGIHSTAIVTKQAAHTHTHTHRGNVCRRLHTLRRDAHYTPSDLQPVAGSHDHQAPGTPIRCDSANNWARMNLSCSPPAVRVITRPPAQQKKDKRTSLHLYNHYYYLFFK